MGDICIIACDDGFELVGSAIRECLGNQTWSGTDATCVKSQPGMLVFLTLTLIC